LRGEVVHQWLESFYVSGCEKISFEFTPEEMLRFVQSLQNVVVPKIVASGSFGDVRTYAIGTPHNLPADRVFGERVPSDHDCPNLICQFLGQLVDTKIFIICPAHYFDAADYQPLTAD
jgi:hypothetical protein